MKKALKKKTQETKKKGGGVKVEWGGNHHILWLQRMMKKYKANFKPEVSGNSEPERLSNFPKLHSFVNGSDGSKTNYFGKREDNTFRKLTSAINLHVMMKAWIFRKKIILRSLIKQCNLTANNVFTFTCLWNMLLWWIFVEKNKEYSLTKQLLHARESCVPVYLWTHMHTHTYTREEYIRVGVCEDPDKFFTVTPQGQ